MTQRSPKHSEIDSENSILTDITTDQLVEDDDSASDNDELPQSESVDIETHEKNKKISGKVIAIIIAAALVVLVVGAYIAGMYMLKGKFLPNTYINGIDVSLMTAEEAEKATFIDGAYVFTVMEKDGQEEIDLHETDYVFIPDKTTSELLDAQNYNEWPKKLFSKTEVIVENTAEYDEDKLVKLIKGLKAFDSKNTKPSENAYVYVEDDYAYIADEVYGTELDESKALTAIKEAVAQGLKSIDLNTIDVYKLPEITSADAELVDHMLNLNTIGAPQITIDLKGATEILSSEDVLKFCTVYDDGSFIVNDDYLYAYVAQLAEKYDTYMKPRDFVTHSGEKIKVGGSILYGEDGDAYGFLMDQYATAEELKDAIYWKSSTTVEAEWEMEGLTHDVVNGDIGNTYIEINISDQHMWYWVNGEVALETDIVTGLYSDERRRTPEGVFKIIEKARNVTLKGTLDGLSWASFVEYWMAVTYTGVGIHDASWQPNYGGEYYTYRGSHGCINTPYDVVSELYEMVECGTPVVIYSFFDDNITAEGVHATQHYFEVEGYAGDLED